MSTEIKKVPAEPAATQLPEDGGDSASAPQAADACKDSKAGAKEIGGREGPDPTRYGDWEKNGRCIDF